MTRSTVVHQNIEVEKGRQSKDMDHIEWQPLLRQFSTIKTLHVCKELAKPVARALDDPMEDMVAEVLPSLDLIRLQGQPGSSIKKFIAARQLSGRPVTVIKRKREFDERLKSYTSKYDKVPYQLRTLCGYLTVLTIPLTHLGDDHEHIRIYMSFRSSSDYICCDTYIRTNFTADLL